MRSHISISMNQRIKKRKNEAVMNSYNSFGDNKCYGECQNLNDKKKNVGATVILKRIFSIVKALHSKLTNFFLRLIAFFTEPTRVEI